MSARQHAAAVVQAAATGGVLYVIGAAIRGPDARPSMLRDFGAGALVVGAVLVLKWAGQQ